VGYVDLLAHTKITHQGGRPLFLLFSDPDPGHFQARILVATQEISGALCHAPIENAAKCISNPVLKWNGPKGSLKCTQRLSEASGAHMTLHHPFCHLEAARAQIKTGLITGRMPSNNAARYASPPAHRHQHSDLKPTRRAAPTARPRRAIPMPGSFRLM